MHSRGSFSSRLIAVGPSTKQSSHQYTRIVLSLEQHEGEAILLASNYYLPSIAGGWFLAILMEAAIWFSSQIIEKF